MPPNRNGGQKFMKRRSAAGVAARMSEQYGRHLAPIGADQLLVIEHVERSNQALFRRALVPVALGLEDVQELVQTTCRIVVEQQAHAEQVARREVVAVASDARAQLG